MKNLTLNQDCSLGEIRRKSPFALSLSNHELPFDKALLSKVEGLRANGNSPNEQSRLNTH